LLLYYEVYDPGPLDTTQSAPTAENKNEIHLLSNVSFFRGKSKVFESSLVELHAPNARDRKAGIFELDLPLTDLKPGFYTCQVNIVDDAAGHFLFPRLALLLRPENKTRIP